MTDLPFAADPLSACCGDPGDCNRAHLYCFNRTPKEADVTAMNKFEQDKIETPEQRKAFDVAFNAAAAVVPARVFHSDDVVIRQAEQAAAQAIINAATHGSIGLPPGAYLVDGFVTSTPPKDEIKRPDHYARFAIEPCTFIMLNELPYWAGNVVKYVVRAPHKHSDERIDIRKAIRYCEMRIEELDRVAAGTDGDVIGRPL